MIDNLSKYYYNEGRHDMRHALRSMIAYSDPFQFEQLKQYYLDGSNEGGRIIKSYRQGLKDIVKERMNYAR